ncbi:alpha/beta hydrolase [Robiginitalea sp. M366]|uniref:alpha/beta hydrolase n=1 Tax=Robiginitalea aestuariiviva TaxID=3036903 RepID=UPI00240DBEA5|nr:alpha/beta hydrolase [Robiginitalea aestuariiviva]MDG1572653.1 alpha/beta hydrolase [Robiginitalea aestuariiviva]
MKKTNVFTIMEGISIASNVTYKTTSSKSLQLDVYYPAKKLGKEPWDKISEEKKPVLIYIHGGGWVEGDRTSRFLGLLPYLEKGWCVVNIDYRLLDNSHLVESLNDCLDAINWVNENSTKYKFDTEQLYLSGESAGGHLALLAGMIDANQLEVAGVHNRKGKIKGIINWYGITHMERALEFWNDSTYTKLIVDQWKGAKADYLKMVSPIEHISSDTPPIISIHGDEDENVEIGQAIAFHNRLELKGIRNELIKIRGKKHGDFCSKELEHIFNDIWRFYGMD